MIVRLPGSYPTRCRAVIHNGIATFFAVAPSLGPSTYDQTKAALAVVDKTLAEVGSSKDLILTATVFIADMAQKDEMNRAWDEWADRDNAPMRVCVSAASAGLASWKCCSPPLRRSAEQYNGTRFVRHHARLD
jgi:enamine deaminase RidA (YjgF/YER057c/UK114 family)